MTFSVHCVLVAVFAGAAVARGQCDTPVQTHHLYAPDGGANDLFGIRLDLSGEWAFVGAADHMTNGAAYCFRNTSGTWEFSQKFTPTFTGAPPRFGYGVATDGARLALAAIDETIAGQTQAGAVYTYRFDGSTWVSSGKIPNPEPQFQNFFGIAVTMSGDRMAVGSQGRTVSGFQRAGSVFVYEWNGSSWLQVQRIDNPLPATGDVFGAMVEMDGDWLAVCAELDDASAADSGSVYMYEHDGGAWVYRQTLARTGAGPTDAFGVSLALVGTALVVGAPFHDVAGADAGSVYLYEFDGVGWVETQRLNASPPAVADIFGACVAFDGVNLLVGAVAGPGAAVNSGAVYVFREVAGIWTQQSILSADDGANGDQFSGGRRSIALDNGVVLIGSVRDDTSHGIDAGSAYIFDLDPVGLTIDDQPDSITTGPGQTVMITAAVSGTAPIAYQWRRNGTPVLNHFPFSGANSPALTISPTFINFGGTFDCVISNICGSMVTTDPATLSVPECPGDADGSRTVTFQDVTAVLANFNAVCP